MYNKKILLFFIIVSFLISIILAFQIVDTLDKYESDGIDHHIVKGDISDIWARGAQFKKDIISGKNFLVSGSEIYRSYLPPRLIGFFSIIFDYDLLSIENGIEKINLGFKKFYYLLLQSIIFYSVLVYFYNNFSKLENNSKITFYTLIFLSFCPNIFLYNSAFHTESIFFSLQLLLMTLLISPSTTLKYNILIGLILSLLFMQKTVGIFYIFVVCLYLILCFKRKSIKSIFIIFITYVSILTIIGFSNFKRVGVFYFMPTQGNEAVYHYLAHDILVKGKNMTGEKAGQKLNKDLKNWKLENQIENENLEKSRIQIMKFKKKYTLHLIQENPIVTLKIISWKALQTGILNPVYIFHYHFYEQDIYKKPPYYLEKDYLNFWTPIKISYSLLIYFIIFLGFINSIKKLDLKYNLFLFLSATYMFAMLSWVGNSRYFSTSLIYLSIYFGYGISFLLDFTSSKTSRTN